jgi:hypothetical protein
MTTPPPTTQKMVISGFGIKRAGHEGYMKVPIEYVFEPNEIVTLTFNNGPNGESLFTVSSEDGRIMRDILYTNIKDLDKLFEDIPNHSAGGKKYNKPTRHNRKKQRKSRKH